MLGNRNLVRIVVATAFLALCAAPSILTQEKTADSNIKVQAVNVVVDLIVTDRHGRHVQGLTAADFKIYEDGVPQKIIGFTPSAGSALDSSSPAVAAVSDANAKPGQYQEFIRRGASLLGQDFGNWRLCRHLLY